MTASTLFVIDNQPLSTEQALDYLQASGRLPFFVEDILREHAFTQALEEFKLQVQEDLTSESIEKIAQDFRTTNQLLDDEAFLVWLKNSGLSYQVLQQQLVENWILQQFQQTSVSTEAINDYFMANSFKLDRFLLSWVSVESEELAQELHDQISEQSISFDQAVRQCLLANERTDFGWMKLFRREELQVELQAAIKEQPPGSCIAPVSMNDRWYLVQLEKLIKASLGELKEELRTQLFEQKLSQRVAVMSVKLEVTRWVGLKTSTR